MTGRTLSQYRLLEEIGRWEMGIVYEALDLKLNLEVALARGSRTDRLLERSGF